MSRSFPLSILCIFPVACADPAEALFSLFLPFDISINNFFCFFLRKKNEGIGINRFSLGSERKRERDHF